MRALVTGGLGFVGTHLTDKLVADGFKVDIVDNCQSSTVKAYDHPNVNVIIGDIGTFIPIVNYDYIFHCASVVGPVGVLKYAGKISRLIIDELQSVIRITQQNDSKLLFISTSELYGPSSQMSMKESDPKIAIETPSARQEYAVGKLLSEISLLNMHKAYGLKVNIIRPFNIVGPRQQAQPGGFVMPRFITQAITGKPLTVYNDGESIRSFTHVKDIVSAIMAITNSDQWGEVYNTGNPANTIKIKDLAKKVLEKIPSSSVISFVNPVILHGPLYREAFDKVANIDKIRSKLGWKPIYTLDETIDDCVKYYLAQL